GYTISLPKNDDSHVTKNRLNDEIAMMLGGRAAEEIVIQDISTGASQDIKRATGIARSMVCEWGMSDSLPNVFFGGDREVFIGRDYQTQHNYSESMAAVIDKEIKDIIEINYQRALTVLRANSDLLDSMVKLLYERETIYSEEVEMLMERKPLEEINDYIDKKLAKQEQQNNVPNASVFKPASAIIVPEPHTDTPPAPTTTEPAGE
ncbi:MAG: cell division protein FtsH, partial [Clostridia bacterium]|nr:cell division protein FtsH [Clostridia bacterium]